MASHAIFQYNVLTIDDTHNAWTNMIVKMTILRLLGSSDDKEKISVARPDGAPLRWFRIVGGKASVEETVKKSVAPVEPMPKHRCIRCLSEGPTPWCL